MMADFNFYDKDVLDEGENDADSSYPFLGRDSVIFAVQCRGEMFKDNEQDNEPYPFKRICEATKDMLRNKIICSERDLQAVIFFGTCESKNPGDFNHIFVVQDLDSPSASRIEELQKLEDFSLEEFEGNFGLSKEVQISELLWCCSSVFSRSTLKLASKTVLLFAWDDDPHHGDRNAQLRARTKAGDLMEQDTLIQVFSFNPAFNYDRFYKDIMSESEANVAFFQNPIHGITNLYDFLLRKCSKQRAIGKIPFQLFEGMALSVGIYTPVRRATKGKTVNIDSTKNKEVQLKSNFVEKTTGDILMTADVKLSQKWGGRDIIFDYEEVEEMKKFSGAGMKLLGFKPKEKAIKLNQHVRPAQFIYPSEKSVKGSTTLFSALLTKCLSKNVVPICSLSPRSNSPPRLVALLPHQPEETDDSSSEQIQSPGFYVIYLPFSEDIRDLDIKETQEPIAGAVEAAEKIVRKLRFTYRPASFDNPALQTHYRNLEAMALDKDKPEEIEDLTMPNWEKINNKAGELISQFKSQVYPPDYDPSAKATNNRVTATKRKADDVNGGQTKQTNIEDVKELAVTGKLVKLTVPALKEICKNNSIRATGKKKDIIGAIEQFFL